MQVALRTALVIALATASLAAAEFHFTYAGPEDSPAWNGLQLGVAEANVQGKFLGTTFTVERNNPNAERQREPIAVFTANNGRIASLSNRAGERAVFNLSDGDDAIRSACIANAFHTIPSDKMKQDAVAQWKKKDPTAEVSAAAWHSAAVKFAARDLNKRYAKKFGKPMDEQAWAGWFAGRVAADTLMRNTDAGPAELVALLKDGEFDGQKGDPHSFRKNGQLRQPLMIISSTGELLGEAPVRGIATDLDSLGSTTCE